MIALAVRPSLLTTVVWCTALASTAANAGAQRVAEWRVDPAAAYDSRMSDAALHRVTGADFLSNGDLAIADAGNRRLVIVAPESGRVRVLGREGDGPGEFRWISRIRVFGDTVVAYDPTLNRVTSLSAEGTVVSTTPIPAHDGRFTRLLASADPGRFIIGAHLSSGGERSGRGLYVDTVLLLRFQPSTTPEALRREPFEHRYLMPQAKGWTAYRVPFYGTTLVAASGGRYATVGLGRPVMDFRDMDGRLVGSVALPVRPRIFERRIIERHADSVVAMMRGSGGARFAPELTAQTRAVYEALPSPELVPAVRTVFWAGDEVWVEVHPVPGDARVRWYVVAADTMTIRGYLELPISARLLAANSRSVAVLTKDSDDQEFIRIHAIHK